MFDQQPLNHSRLWSTNRYVYPVASRRARGISIGINLNIDKVCNFGCVYCEVNRGFIPLNRDIDLAAMMTELQSMLQLAANGELARDERFTDLNDALGAPLPVRDIAFSGDGEPTTFRNFDQAVDAAIALRDDSGMQQIKIVIITNATMFQRPRVFAALQKVYASDGEVWAKLDAGTEEYYHTVDATTIPFARILTNLHHLSQAFPIVIQTCFMRLHGMPPQQQEVAAYADRLRSLLDNGGAIARVQLYTVSRPPAEHHVTSLDDNELQVIQQQVATALPELPIEIFGGAWAGYTDSSASE